MIFSRIDYCLRILRVIVVKINIIDIAAVAAASAAAENSMRHSYANRYAHSQPHSSNAFTNYY